ncbi:pyridoxal phosphate biosynthetic protein [Erythrobacter sp.]|uniref:pyridoxal phosphate biosynthetic protein n=1 Tax=Erythrobacter sp. TaxID=1042 RepID=UPI001425CA58|nr:pyridoxal phosphate biosynthetic protein [Erythrobacter sp.]QIQ86670.1 MAG: pyridoxal phosphate biosynthetic protein [Erythrobacter sp.]
MAGRSPHELTAEQSRWAFFGATLFLTAVGFLGYAVAKGVILPFAIGWVVLQVFGYAGSLSRAKGDFAHPLFKSQVMIHVVVLGLLVALILRGPPA